MSNTRSDSSESISIYETPINSPSNESLIDSTRIDSSLFGNTSVNTHSIDLLDFRQSFESIPSGATQSTLRQTVQRLNSECAEDNPNQPFIHSTDASLPEPSVWYSSQIMSSLRNPFLDSNRSDVFVLLNKYMSELESEKLELIGVEQQMYSLSLKCRSIRENMSSKTHAINTLMTEILPNKKQTAQKSTQTDLEDIPSVPQSCDMNESVLKPLIAKPLVQKSNPEISSVAPNIISKTDSSKNNFQELSNDLKKRLSGLPAMVKGYLTRRLMKTEKVLHKIETIRDTTQLLSTYRSPSNKKITPEDLNFHKRLIIQLESSCHELYDIFFNYPKSSQMGLIRRSREHILDRHYRTASVLSNSSYLNSSLRNQSSPQMYGLSSVTKKVIERKIQRNRKSLNSSLSKNSNQISSSNKSRSSGSTSVKSSADKINCSVRRSQRNAGTNSLQTHKRRTNFDKK